MHESHQQLISNEINHSKTIQKPTFSTTKYAIVTPQTYLTSEPTQSWKTWHKQFSHISYPGLQKLFDLKLVSRFNVDTWRPKLDCIACTEAIKLCSEQVTEPGELIHIEMWGKYCISSINGKQYYVILINDHG